MTIPPYDTLQPSGLGRIGGKALQASQKSLENLVRDDRSHATANGRLVRALPLGKDFRAFVRLGRRVVESRTRHRLCRRGVTE